MTSPGERSILHTVVLTIIVVLGRYLVNKEKGAEIA